jgi:hypothetical protein
MPAAWRASLLSGPVQMALILEARAASMAWSTKVKAARPVAAFTVPGVNSSILMAGMSSTVGSVTRPGRMASGSFTMRAWKGRPVVRAQAARTLALPKTTVMASGGRSGPRARRQSSGPTPAGSPMVRAMRGIMGGFMAVAGGGGKPVCGGQKSARLPWRRRKPGGGGEWEKAQF